MAPAQTDGANTETKSSKWNPFSKNKRKSAEVKKEEQPAVSPTKDTPPSDHLRPSGDSAYGGSGGSEPNNSLTTVASSNNNNNNNNNGNNNSLTSSTNSPNPQSQPVQSAAQPNHSVPVTGDMSHSSPTVKKEVHNAGNNTSVTTVTTTTTTTTVVSGPQGTTTIEEPRAELPAGQTTPQPQSEAVTQAINNQGGDGGSSGTNNDQSSQQAGDGGSTSDSTQTAKTVRRRSLTPGRRPIPERDPNRLSPITPSQSHDARFQQQTQPQPQQSNSTSPQIPERSPNRSSFPRPLTIGNNDAQAQGPPTPSSPRAAHNFSRPGRSQPPYHQGQYAGPGPQQNGGGSTLDNLKTAAAGIHGVAETLRGTVRAEADRRLRPDKATAADYEHNQHILNKGRQEIESGQFVRRPNNNNRNSSNHSPPDLATYMGQDDRPANGYRQPPQQNAAGIPPGGGVDQNGNPVSGFQRPESWATASSGSGSTVTDDGSGRGRMSKWLRKSTSHPSDRQASSGDLREQRQRAKLRRRSGSRGLRTLRESLREYVAE